MKKIILISLLLTIPLFSQLKVSWGIGAEFAKQPVTTFLGAEYPFLAGANAQMHFDLGLRSQIFLEASGNLTGRRYQSSIFTIDLSQISYGGSLGFKLKPARSIYFSVMATILNNSEERKLSYNTLNNGLYNEVKTNSTLSFGPGAGAGYLYYITNTIAIDLSARYNFMVTPGGSPEGTLSTSHYFGGRLGLYFR